MLISDLTAEQIASFVRNYESKGVVSGGKFTLAELLQEQNRRQPEVPFGTLDTARAILDLAGRSPDGLTTYGAVWQRLEPNKPWGLPSRSVVTKALERVGFYCVQHGLPLIITLVVNGTKGELTEAAKNNIYDYWVKRGFTAGQDRDTFIEEQQRLSRDVAMDRI